jgi:GGDEF domain-containing protein
VAAELTCSIGIARLEEQAAGGIEDVLVAAELAVAVAKRQGRARVALSGETKLPG